MKYHELKGDVKKMKDEIDNLEDATFLVEESMGEGLHLFMGECFVTVDEDQGNTYVSKVVDEKTEELEKKNDEIDALEAEMKNLKSYLYARFGSSINLEEQTD